MIRPTTRKRGEYYHSALDVRGTVHVSKIPMVNKKTALRHAGLWKHECVTLGKITAE